MICTEKWDCLTSAENILNCNTKGFHPWNLKVRTPY